MYRKCLRYAPHTEGALQWTVPDLTTPGRKTARNEQSVHTPGALLKGACAPQLLQVGLGCSWSPPRATLDPWTHAHTHARTQRRQPCALAPGGWGEGAPLRVRRSSGGLVPQAEGAGGRRVGPVTPASFEVDARLLQRPFLSEYSCRGHLYEVRRALSVREGVWLGLGGPWV